MSIATTTLTLILDGYSTLIKALTPTTNTSRRFDRVRPDAPLDGLATGDPTWVRRFDWAVIDAGDLLGLLDHTACERAREVELVVAYPSAARLYGVEPQAQLTTMERDLIQLSDLIESPSHYVSGQNLGRVTGTHYDEQEGFYLLRVTVRLHYYETRSIG